MLGLPRPVFLLTAMLLLLSYCGTRSSDIPKASDDLVIRSQSENSLTQIFSMVKVVPLETSDESLIGFVSKVEVNDDGGILIGDYRSTKQVFRFDASGSRLYQVGRICTPRKMRRL